jgi:hypothetical protein
MNDLIEFLTSKEIIVVYIVALVACLLCFIIYMVEKNTEKRRRRQNTRELNKLVEEVREEEHIKDEPVQYETPVLQPIESTNEASSVVELLESTAELEGVKTQENEGVKDSEPVIIETVNKPEEVSIEEVINERQTHEVNEVLNVEAKEEAKEELQYTSIEPDQATAQLELKKLTEELRKQEEEKQEIEQVNENIALTNYEEEQEENAIISLEELVRKSKEMYEANELSQYADEGNEPISLQDLERQMGERKSAAYDEPFIISEVVPVEELEEEATSENNKVVLDDLNTISVSNTQVEEKQTDKKFHSSPIISPIYGIEKTESSNDLELENTANYDKLDEEIKKTNEFLMTLKELQKKLD